MKFIDFFAGVGGFRRGMELAGHECIGFCEWDKYATASYISMHLIMDTQRTHLKSLGQKKRQKEILKEEYRNGEWYSDDIRNVDAGSLPKADCWCFGFPCQDISIAGKQAGFDGERSSLFFAVTGLIRKLKEKDRPRYLFIENVKNLLSINKGWDFLKLLAELDEIGYDAQWQVLNSKDFGVPQNRERVFIVANLRSRGGCEVFPVEGADGENSVRVVANSNAFGYECNGRIYDIAGISPCLNGIGNGGGHEPKVIVPLFCDMNYGAGLKITDISRCLQSGYYKGVCGRAAETSGVAIPVLTPDRAKKRQNGRRFKEDGEPMFTLTGQDRHGVGVSIDNICIDLKSFSSQTRGQPYRYGAAATLDHNCNQGIFVKVSDNLTVYAVWYEEYQCYIAIRRLTPRECFRLQGWTDDYFEKAQFVNSDSQLYKQAGNGVTVPVIEAIARKLT